MPGGGARLVCLNAADEATAANEGNAGDAAAGRTLPLLLQEQLFGSGPAAEPLQVRGKRQIHPSGLPADLDELQSREERE